MPKDHDACVGVTLQRGNGRWRRNWDWGRQIAAVTCPETAKNRAQSVSFVFPIIQPPPPMPRWIALPVILNIDRTARFPQAENGTFGIRMAREFDWGTVRPLIDVPPYFDIGFPYPQMDIHA